MDEISAPVRFNQTCVLENPQVLGYRARRNAGKVRQGSYAERPFYEEPDDLHAFFDSKRPEYPRYVRLVKLVHVI